VYPQRLRKTFYRPAAQASSNAVNLPSGESVALVQIQQPGESDSVRVKKLREKWSLGIEIK